jgi:hypothetical protein
MSSKGKCWKLSPETLAYREAKRDKESIRKKVKALL